MARLIIIDDHPSVLKLLSAVCQAEGHEVTACDNAEAGLRAIEELTPEVALVDRRLGEEDGLDLVSRCRQRSPGTRCIMVTACTETADVVQAMRQGAFNYVTKPFESEQIVAAVNEALNTPPESPPTKTKLVIVYPKQAA